MLFACVAQKELDALSSNSLATVTFLNYFFLTCSFNFCHIL